MLWKTPSNFLKDKYKHLYEQIHPYKNLGLNKETLDYDSYKKIWWLCKCGEEWEQIVCLRSIDRYCPTCIKNRKKPKKINLPIFKSRLEIENYWIQAFSIPENKIQAFREFTKVYSNEEIVKPIARITAKKGTIADRVVAQWLGVSRKFVNYWKNKKLPKN